MMENFIESAEHIYLCCGVTDFRKQIDSLCVLVTEKLKLDPYSGTCVFIFCNRKRNGLKVLRFEDNGFILAHKKLLNVDKMKFQWPKDEDAVKDITFDQIKWLLQGLNVKQKKALRKFRINKNDIVY